MQVAGSIVISTISAVRDLCFPLCDRIPFDAAENSKNPMSKNTSSWLASAFPWYCYISSTFYVQQSYKTIVQCYKVLQIRTTDTPLVLLFIIFHSAITAICRIASLSPHVSRSTLWMWEICFSHVSALESKCCNTWHINLKFKQFTHHFLPLLPHSVWNSSRYFWMLSTKKV